MINGVSASPKTKSKLVFKIIILGAVLVLLAGAAVLVYAYSQVNKPRTQFANQKQFDVKRGESFTVIAVRLQQEGLISSSTALRLYTVLTGARKLQAGTYALDSSMSPRQILAVLEAGNTVKDGVRVTFPEGDTVREYAARLEDAGLGDAGGFIRASSAFADAKNFSFLADKPGTAGLEGYLFPDTYDFRKNAASGDIITVLLKNFDRKLTQAMRDDIRLQGKTVFEIVTMASIIEGEVGRNYKKGTVLSDQDRKALEEERRLVAGVFYNRLSARHPLQSDATIVYITGSRRHQATYEETKIDSPYNTYTHAGLPPGPINNPSLDSISAAIYPADTDYFYFLSKPDGEAVFAKTLEEHNANKARYLP